MDAAAQRLRAQCALAVVGVDAGKFHHALVVRGRDSRDSKPLIFPTTRAGFEQALAYIRAGSADADPGSVLVGIEFAGSYGATFAFFLDTHGYPVVSVLGNATKAWAKAVHGTPLKTDAKDAITIVDLVSHGRFAGYPFLKPVYAELRVLTAGIRRVVRLRGGAVNTLRSVLQSVWPEYETHFTSFTQTVTPLRLLAKYPGPVAFQAAPRRTVLAALKSFSRGYFGTDQYDILRASAEQTVAIPGTETILQTQVTQLIHLIAVYDEQIEVLEAAMATAMQNLPEAQALLTIPRVSVRSVGLFLGAIGDPRAYEAPEQVLRLAGLNLMTKESGIQRGTHRISKRGRSEVRQQVYLLALGMVQKDMVYHAAYQAMIARNGGRKKKALVAISRRVLALMFSIARDRRPFDATRVSVSAPYRRAEGEASPSA